MHERIVLHAEPASVGTARRFCAGTLGRWGASRNLVDSACLLVSELVTNAILHAGTTCELTVTGPADASRGVIRIEVTDGDAATPVTKRYDVEVEAGSGRGLQLVEALSQRFGTRQVDAGKAVWCEMPWEAAT
jgi:anti-sigma regulatory factor (Ser/Thr protein kinase)